MRYINILLLLLQQAISGFSFASASKRVQVRNHSCENLFYQYLHCHAEQAHFCMKSFPIRLVLKLKERELGNGILFIEAVVTKVW